LLTVQVEIIDPLCGVVCSLSRVMAGIFGGYRWNSQDSNALQCCSPAISCCEISTIRSAGEGEYLLVVEQCSLLSMTVLAVGSSPIGTSHLRGVSLKV